MGRRASPPFGAAGGVWEIACRGAQIRSLREPDPLGHAEMSVSLVEGSPRCFRLLTPQLAVSTASLCNPVGNGRRGT